MIKWLMRLFKQEPRAYAVEFITTRCLGTAVETPFGTVHKTKIQTQWVKCVVVGRPNRHTSMDINEVVGPFRSELDCDEFIKTMHPNAPQQQEQKEPWQE